MTPLTPRERIHLVFLARLYATHDASQPLPLPRSLDDYEGLCRLDRSELDETDAPPCVVVRPWTLRALVMGRAA